MDKVKEFHDHLDECQQCREHPFNLCLIGQNLLEQCISQEDMPVELNEFVSKHFWDLI